MGKVILVPSTIPYDHVEIQDHQCLYGSIRDWPVISDGEKSSVLIAYPPKPDISSAVHDPMLHIQKYYNFEYTLRSSGSIIKRKKSRPYPLVHRIASNMLSHRFWDHYEIEEIVQHWRGDLLLQINEHDWSFIGTSIDDSDELSQLVGKYKKHQFRVPSLLRDEIQDWLNDHATEYDYINEYGYPNPNYKDTVYVRNDIEAVHFKLRWYGEEPAES